MVRKKRKLIIFLADLTHTGIRIATENIPLNLGLIASYALKKFGSDIKIEMFKYPDKLLHALQHKKYDVLGSSTYIWNNNLSEWSCEMAKKYNPNVVTVRGGWNFPLDEEQQKEYLQKHKFTDIFCLHEGEAAFANVIERLLGIENMAHWNDKPLDGCVFLNENSFIKGSLISRINDLDAIPSPYVTGLLDEFFDGKLTPIVETTRGCPFQCNYCNNSNGYYNKVNFFSIEYITAEINYIASKIAPTGIKNLLIADTNFGMYSRDKEIALVLKATQEKYKWPFAILASTGKNKVESIMDSTKVLGDALIISMSVQSMNPETLKIIKRDNINLNMYEKISEEMWKTGRPQVAEVIVPLPGETYSSYMKSVEKLIDIGAKRIVSYTLQLNNGTAYKDKDFRQRFGYKGKYRLIPNDFGIYGDKKIFDYEEAAPFNNSLNFEEYLKIRKLALVMELAFSNSIFHEVFKLLDENGISNYKFLIYLLEKLEDSPLNVKKVFASFVSDTINELKDSEEALVDYYSDEKNYEKLKAGEIGGNVIFKHKGIMLSKYMTFWIEYIFNCAGSILRSGKKGARIEEKIHELDDIKSFVTAKLDGLFSPARTAEIITLDVGHDILFWLKSSENLSLKFFKNNNGLFKYKFYFNENQKVERDDLFNRYGSDVSGLSKILARVPTLERMFRNVKKVK